jgi:hypothetical protein
MLENSSSATKIAPFCEKFSVTFKTSIKRSVVEVLKNQI